ncbi:MAG: GNAT family N-acetyltransferase [Ardenticatenaceae bacterium]|nr:GNAT family N-acetyltransferase [Ardenticatenaceae bacterium]MCB9444629.1 GNAT family N-acetyltransferase [Ardenticatenaceae bacterium]
MRIRAWRKADTAVLRKLHQTIHPGQPFPLTRHVWLVEEAGRGVGYTAVIPVPGLEGIYNLDGGILSNYRRQGLGSRLLQHVLHEAPGLNIRQLSHSFTDLNSPAAHFLRRHNFFIEHEEWLMTLSPLLPCSPAHLPDCQIQTHPTPIHLFRRLYDQSFGGTPWYQPYSQEEVENTLDDPGDILFLYQDEQPIGFAWLQEDLIEPIGIVREEWGKGYGRFLFLAALHELQNRGKTQANIGVWRSNQAAIRLYQSVGFQHQQTITYLAFDVQ